MKLSLPILLSFNGGYVDTAGFLALQGLFTAHVTGNFVTFGAAVVYGTSGAVAKLLALPMFCIVVVLVRALSYRLPGLGLPVLKTMLTLKFALLTIGASLAVSLGPFSNGDSWSALFTSMTLVSAMAIQNAIHRIHLSNAPPTTLMTGTSTQIMIDIGDLMLGGPGEARVVARARLAKMTTSVAVFAAGCGMAALAFTWFHMWSFVVPPVIGLVALVPRSQRAGAHDP
jgi:uncharacterized membrane protein YoaK (UPF0700 family)